MRFAAFVSLFLSVALASATPPTPTRTLKRADSSSKFVTAGANGKFQFNGSEFTFVGTNAYWLPTLLNDKDINDTLRNISAAGIKVVRLWAFNDVSSIPVNGTWLQLIANGTTSVNNGTNGLQRLDRVVELAEEAGLFVILSLTNNWNPLPLLDSVLINTTADGTPFSRRDVTVGTNNSLPRNFLSNDYGGMDAYVREFGVTKTHDEFYLNQTILALFQNYTTQIVRRYVNSVSLLGYETANDPRCNSSIPTSPLCKTTTITNWTQVIAQHIKSIDNNHLVTSGNHGFFCPDCHKLFPLKSSPAPSPTFAAKKRRGRGPMTRERLVKERKENWKRTKAAQKRHEKKDERSLGKRIRGSWFSYVDEALTKRQTSSSAGSAFDGSAGVDSEDIINIPEIGFGTFQLFPDQNSYFNGAPDPNLSPFNNTVQAGISWIAAQAQTGLTFSKPITLSAFGLVTQANSPFFIPFNTTTAPFGNDTTPATQTYGVTNIEQNEAYQQWLNEAQISGLAGISQYQWSQTNLTSQAGTEIAPNATGQTALNPVTGQSPAVNQTGESPNDGYGIAATGSDGIIGQLSDAAAATGPD